MKKLLFTLMLFATMHGNAQVANDKEVPYIEVTGTAEKEVVPDIIYISITLSDKIEGKSTYTLDDQEQKLKQALKNLNIDLSNLSLSGANSDVIMKRQKEKGIAQRKDYMLKVSTAAQVNQVFEALYNNNIKEASIARVDHSQITALRKEVRISAIKAAKEKAVYLLEAIGEQPAKPLIIREENYSMPYAAAM
ncbi:SIMPL domain-containing protein [Flavobacterium hauense]